MTAQAKAVGYYRFAGLIAVLLFGKPPRQQGVRLYYTDWYTPHVGLVRSIQ